MNRDLGTQSALLYRCVGNTVHLMDHGHLLPISLPGIPATPPHVRLTGSSRFLVMGNHRCPSFATQERPTGAHGLWLYDSTEDQIDSVPHDVQIDDLFTHDAVCGPDGALYFSDGNTFWRWRPGTPRTEKLLRFQRTKGAPIGLDISPDGRYLSYVKFRSDSQMFHLYDLGTGTVRDLRFSIFHYGWLDAAHVAWSKSSGIKLLNIETGKSRTVLRDHRAILKRGGQAADVLAPFLPEPDVWEEMNVLGIREGQIWFSLWLRCRREPLLGDLSGVLGRLKRPAPAHTGIWSVKPDGSCPRLQLSLPDTVNLHTLSLLPDGEAGWEEYTAEDVVTTHLWDGTTLQSFPGWQLLTAAPIC